VTVELFLVLPVLILVVVASIQLVGVARARIELQGAAREGQTVCVEAGGRRSNSLRL